MRFTLTNLYVALAAATTALAATLDIRQSAINTPLSYPQGITWYAGQMQFVTWSVSNLPTNATYEGSLYLTKGGDLPQGSSAPFMSNFPLAEGTVKITVPEVQTGDDYAWVLTTTLPPSDILIKNVGPTFTIVNSGSATTSSFTEGSTFTQSTAATGSTTSGGTASTSSTGTASTTSVATSGSSTVTSGSGTSKSTATSPSSGSSGTSTSTSSSTSSTSSAAKSLMPYESHARFFGVLVIPWMCAGLVVL